MRAGGRGGAALLAAAGGVCLVGAIGLGTAQHGRSASVQATPFGTVTDAPAVAEPAADASAAPSGPGDRTGRAATPTTPSTGPPPPSGSVAVLSGDPPVVGAPPAELVLPGDPPSPVEPVGVLAGGDLQVPTDPGTVGWWVGSAVPGDPDRRVVFAGHVDSHALGRGSFAALVDLAPGDAVHLTDGAGTSWSYVVTARGQLPKAALPAEIFTPGSGPGIVMITCGGDFDRSARRYADNIIVYADPVPPP